VTGEISEFGFDREAVMPSSHFTLSRPALAIKTPCATRHLVFFFPKRELTTVDKDALSDKYVRAKLLSYARLLYAFSKRVQNHNDRLDIRYVAGEKLFLDNFRAALEKREKIFINLGCIFEFRLRCSIILYHEHVTITYILDNLC
jgi:hypothetical protein